MFSLITPEIAKVFAENIFETFNYVFSKQLKQIISNRILEYIIGTAKDCSSIKTILFPRGVEINQIYYPIKLNSRNAIFQVEHTSQLFKNNNRIVIEGNAGSGKTTFIKHSYIDAVLSNFKIPVLYNLRELNKIELEDYKGIKTGNTNLFFNHIINHFLFHDIGVDVEVIKKMFQEDKFVFFLEGFDEIKPELREYIVIDIQDFIKRFASNYFVITSRPDTVATRLNGFDNYEISELGESDIIKFVEKQFYNNIPQAKRVISVIKDPENSEYLEMFATPLFLILFIYSFDSNPKIPLTKSKFYHNVFDSLYERHDIISKDGWSHPKVSGLNRDEFELVLFAFSVQTYFENKFEFDRLDVEKVLKKIRRDFQPKIQTTDFIEDLKVTLSILVEDGGIMMFVHRTLQEYFAAAFLENCNEVGKNKFFIKLAKEQVNADHHSFVLELISELYPIEYGQYYIIEHIQEFISTYHEIFKREYPHFSGQKSIAIDYNDLLKKVYKSKECKNIYDQFLLDFDTNYDKSIQSQYWENNELTKEMFILSRNYEELINRIQTHFKEYKLDNDFMDSIFNPTK